MKHKRQWAVWLNTWEGDMQVATFKRKWVASLYARMSLLSATGIAYATTVKAA